MNEYKPTTMKLWFIYESACLYSSSHPNVYSHPICFTGREDNSILYTPQSQQCHRCSCITAYCSIQSMLKRVFLPYKQQSHLTLSLDLSNADLSNAHSLSPCQKLFRPAVIPVVWLCATPSLLPSCLFSVEMTCAIKWGREWMREGGVVLLRISLSLFSVFFVVVRKVVFLALWFLNGGLWFLVSPLGCDNSVPLCALSNNWLAIWGLWTVCYHTCWQLPALHPTLAHGNCWNVRKNVDNAIPCCWLWLN